ncbi:MAG: YlcI/YnfO family protein [Microbacterium sp.]|uniref:YlcI/YnfO family protein n=1 Tax=Microbacterium sp. TaxID=51671 RepID=UPI003A8878AF
MSTQIAVRLPDPVVEFLDSAVADGRASSRAALVTSAIEREMRRQLAERDVQILEAPGSVDDLDSLVDWTVRNARFED